MSFQSTCSNLAPSNTTRSFGLLVGTNPVLPSFDAKNFFPITSGPRKKTKQSMSTFGNVRILSRPLDALFPRQTVDSRVAEDIASVLTSDSEDGGVALPLSPKKKHRAGKKHKRGRRAPQEIAGADNPQMTQMNGVAHHTDQREALPDNASPPTFDSKYGSFLLPPSEKAKKNHRAGGRHRRGDNEPQDTTTADGDLHTSEIVHLSYRYEVPGESRPGCEDAAQEQKVSRSSSRSGDDCTTMRKDEGCHQGTVIRASSPEPASLEKVAKLPILRVPTHSKWTPVPTQQTNPVPPPDNLSVRPAPDDKTATTDKGKTTSPATIKATGSHKVSHVVEVVGPVTSTAHTGHHNDGMYQPGEQTTPTFLPQDAYARLSTNKTLVDASNQANSRENPVANDSADFMPELTSQELYERAREMQNEARRKEEDERRATQIAERLEAEQAQKLAALESKLIPYTSDVMPHAGGGGQVPDAPVRRNDHFYRKLVAIQYKKPIPPQRSNRRSRTRLPCMPLAPVPQIDPLLTRWIQPSRTNPGRLKR